VIGQLQLLMFGALAFCLLILSGLYPAEMRAINLDTDWFYRTLSSRFYRLSEAVLNRINQVCEAILVKNLTARLADWAEHGVAWLLVLLLRPLWMAARLGPTRQDQLRKQIHSLIQDGAVQVGLSVAAAALLLSGLYLFY
jgi:multicomponent Na+:H+ antiporter subunit D